MLSAGWHDRWDVIVGYATGEARELPLSPTFDRRIKLEFHGARITSDGGLLEYREIDDVLGSLRSRSRSSSTVDAARTRATRWAGCFAKRCSVGSPAMRMSTTPSGSPATPRRWQICPEPGLTGCMHESRPSASFSTWTVPKARPTASRSARPGTATSAAPVIARCSCSTSSVIWNAAFCDQATSIVPRTGAWCWSRWSPRYHGRGLDLYFRADAAFAKPEIYELLEAEGIRYAIRLPANRCCSGGSAIC
jgi:hypothetical protein